MEGPRPKVSVYTPTYNYGRFLGEAIQSVLDQTFQDWELIVVDDGSTDGTREVMDAFADPRIHYVYQENQGNPAARNTALRLARGEYVACLDADDAWFPEKLEKQVAKLDSLPPTVGLLYGNVYLFSDEDGSIIQRFLEVQIPPRGQVFKKLLPNEGYFIHDTAALIRREVFDRVGLYDESLLRFQDWEMWVRIARVYEVETLDEPLARVRRHSSNAIGSLDKMHRYGQAARWKVMASYPLNREERRILRQNLALHEYTYGIELLRLGRRGDAWKALFRALRLCPGERKAYVHLALPLLSPRLYGFVWRWYCSVKTRLPSAGQT